MELVLTRQFGIQDATIGTLTVDGKFQCFTLEDVIRETKVYGKTAIPAGIYPVILCESPRFSDKYEKLGRGRIVPLIDQVPGYKGIRIHVGNIAAHSEGCILVGHWPNRNEAKIVSSHKAFVALMKVLKPASGVIRITILNEVEKAPRRLQHPSRPLFEGLFPSICTPP
jgi:hypothetical protein